MPTYTDQRNQKQLDADYCIDGFLVNPDFLKLDPNFSPSWGQGVLRNWQSTAAQSALFQHRLVVNFIYIGNSNSFPSGSVGVPANTIYIATFEADSNGVTRKSLRFDQLYLAAQDLFLTNGSKCGDFS